MSRIGKKEIVIPDKTEISMDSGLISIKGPKGSLERNYSQEISNHPYILLFLQEEK